MARPKHDAPIDLSVAHDLTAGLIERLSCPPGQKQAFLRDIKGNGHKVRVTAGGAKSFVFEAKLNRRTIRRTIGDCRALTIDEARKEARRLQSTLDKGDDPRELDRQKAEADTAARAERRAKAMRETVTGLEAWKEYVAEGKVAGFTRRGKWSERHAQDHDDLADAGGKPFKRGDGTTAAGPLHDLLSRALVSIDSAAVESWLRAETAKRAARAALAFRLLRGFLNWCGEHPVYVGIAQAQAHAPKKVRKLVKKQTPKAGALEREQLKAWFAAVKADTNVFAAAYLQALLLTGARKGEVAGLRWEDVDLRFGGSLTIRDKVEGVRVIPCPPYLAQVLNALPRRNEWVFGPTAPTIAGNAAYNHRRALTAAGLPHLSLHDLRRSFGTLAEWVECPAGVVAQIMGHKPSATAEKHYRARPLDLLRMWHSKIEAWILEQAGVPFVPDVEPGRLRVVTLQPSGMAVTYNSQ